MVRVWIMEQFLAARAGLRDVDRRPNAAIREFSIEYEFHVTSTFELLENEFIHSRTGIDECCSHDR